MPESCDGARAGAETRRKLDRLRALLRATDGLAVAYSGGVDSTFLAAVAAAELGDRALAVTALSPTYPAREQAEAGELAARIGIRQVTVESNELEIPGFSDNPPERCYYCKRELFAVLRRAAREHGLGAVADGTNADDLRDYRPGRRAARESGVMSPLLEAGLGKDEIRALSRDMGLPTADKPAQACLASRFPYGSRITAAKLAQVDAVERVLRESGFRQVRVRHHGETARIEVGAAEIARLLDAPLRAKVVCAGKAAGFAYVTLDLQGYRTGSLNETLTDKPPDSA
ncbi:MAG: ATP-dependent sacrificial sulfur transferase LarE [Lentisphaerae bacterium]|nr:ATP-dependent sacrificial sulfur transferase LarE [Lentisphaerota bacterium]